MKLILRICVLGFLFVAGWLIFQAYEANQEPDCPYGYAGGAWQWCMTPEGS